VALTEASFRKPGTLSEGYGTAIIVIALTEVALDYSDA
jgi:hypothetical protein